MNRFILASVFVLLAAPGRAQDKVIGNIYDAKAKYEKALKMISGVKDLSVMGVNSDLKLVLRVENEETRQAVSRLVGSKLDGHPLQVLTAGQKAEGTEQAPGMTVAAPAHSPQTCGCPCHRQAGKTVADPSKPAPKVDLTRLDDKGYAAEECDVMREYVGLPKREAKNGVRCTQMIGWTNDPEKIKWVQKQNLPHWRSKEMPGLPNAGQDIICYTYIKHRQFCPLGMKQILDDIHRLTPGK